MKMKAIGRTSFVSICLILIGCQSNSGAQTQFSQQELGVKFSYPSNWAEPQVLVSNSDKRDFFWSVYFGPDCGNDCQQHPLDSRTPSRSGVLEKKKWNTDVKGLYDYELAGSNVISDTEKNGMRIIEAESLGLPPPYPKRYLIIAKNSVYQFAFDEPFFSKQDTENFLSSLEL